MMYRVKEIIEPDFGCEGLPDGQEPCCEVLLEDMDSGACRTVKIPDAELYRQVITEGCVVTYEDGVVKKATAAEKMLDGGWQAMYQAAKNVLNERQVSEYVLAGGVAAAIMSSSGKIYTGVCVDTCSTLGICAERNAIFRMLTDGEQTISRALAVMSDGRMGAPCGACRELMVQLMPKDYGNIEILMDYRSGRVVHLGDITPEWWIG